MPQEIEKLDLLSLKLEIEQLQKFLKEHGEAVQKWKENIEDKIFQALTQSHNQIRALQTAIQELQTQINFISGGSGQWPNTTPITQPQVQPWTVDPATPVNPVNNPPWTVQYHTTTGKLVDSLAKTKIMIDTIITKGET